MTKCRYEKITIIKVGRKSVCKNRERKQQIKSKTCKKQEIVTGRFQVCVVMIMKEGEGKNRE